MDRVSVVVNGSVGLSVISSLPPSGTFTIDRTRWFCQKHSPSATPNAATETSTRVRSSSRWPVRSTRSPCWIFLMRATRPALRRGLVLGLGHGDVGLGVGLCLRELGLLVVVVTADRALELAHSATHRASDVRQLLGSDDHQGDDQDDDQFHRSDVRHFGTPLLARHEAKLDPLTATSRRARISPRRLMAPERNKSLRP